MKKSKEFLKVYECEGFRRPSQFKFEIENSPENIAAFIVNAPFDKDYALCDNSDSIVVTTMGQFADLIPDPMLREQVLKHLIPMQMGDAEIPKVKYKEAKRSKSLDVRDR